MDLKESAILGSDAAKHWYYLSKAAARRKYIDPLNTQNIVDVGAGSGLFIRQRLQHTSAECGTSIDSGYATDWDESHCGKPLKCRRTLKSADSDLVLLMDVIEHVDGDVDLIR